MRSRNVKFGEFAKISWKNSEFSKFYISWTQNFLKELSILPLKFAFTTCRSWCVIFGFLLLFLEVCTPRKKSGVHKPLLKKKKTKIYTPRTTFRERKLQRKNRNFLKERFSSSSVIFGFFAFFLKYPLLRNQKLHFRNTKFSKQNDVKGNLVESSWEDIRIGLAQKYLSDKIPNWT